MEGGGEEGQGVVAPVIAPALLDQVAVVDVQMDRHQLHRSHAEAEQVLDGRLRGHARVGAAQLLGHVGMALGEALDVQLVDQCFVPGCPRRMVVAPGEGAVDHRRQRREGGAVALVAGQIGVGVTDLVTEQAIVPAQVAADGLGEGIENELVRIEAVTLLRLIGSVDPVAVELSGLDVGQVGVPDLIGLFAQADALRLRRRLGRIEQAQFHFGGVLGEEREVNSLPVPRCAQRKGLPWPYSHARFSSRWLRLPLPGRPAESRTPDCLSGPPDDQAR